MNEWRGGWRRWWRVKVRSSGWFRDWWYDTTTNTIFMTNLRILPIIRFCCVASLCARYHSNVDYPHTVSYSTDLCCCLPTHPSSSCLPPWYLLTLPRTVSTFPQQHQIFRRIDSQFLSSHLHHRWRDLYPLSTFQRSKIWHKPHWYKPTLPKSKVSNRYIDDISPTTYSSTIILLSVLEDIGSNVCGEYWGNWNRKCWCYIWF